MASRRVERAGSIRLLCSGELDLAARGHFETVLGDAQDDSDRVLLDLKALTFIDCPCLAVLFAAAERSRREGSVLILLDTRGQVRRVIDRVGSPPGVAVLADEDLPGHLASVTA